MVGGPDDVRGPYLNPDSLLARACPGQMFEDFTTSEPSLVCEVQAKRAFFT